MIQLAITYIDKMPTREEKFNLIQTLREATDGKIFVEVEYARCTKLFSEMKEEDGQLDEATETIQEVQIETYGSMEKKEKLEYILYQLKLVLLRKDYVRTQIILKKISRKGLTEKGFELTKINYYSQVIEYYNHEKDNLEVAKCYQTIYDTMVKAEEDKETELQFPEGEKRRNFENFVVTLMITPYSNEQVDLLNIVNSRYARELEAIPVLEKFVHKFLLAELMPLNEDSVKEQLGGYEPFQEHIEFHLQHLEALFKQIIQHNLRVIEKYYSRIRLDRLSPLIGVDIERTEQEIADMVINKRIVAKINRLEGIVKFHKKEFVNDTLNNWNSDIKSLLGKIDKTCHLINREKVVYEK
uniref:PCI domain-containing protein n=1 Tax=Euplotes harpa TaxID=151035 RepID=A0A7S3JDW6_9SPIT|mmetsp:Transcript_30322/g.34732  ORF Transcript_30322/g.34732 Transcript_30322/m.34732 type:complete len:356 (+) Transcript_30322:1-1068(+)